MMTFLDIAARNERDHAEALELLRIQVRSKSAYAADLGDVISRGSARYAIAVEMLAGFMGISVDDVAVVIGKRYEREQKEGVGS